MSFSEFRGQQQRAKHILEWRHSRLRWPFDQSDRGDLWWACMARCMLSFLVSVRVVNSDQLPASRVYVQWNRPDDESVRQTIWGQRSHSATIRCHMKFDSKQRHRSTSATSRSQQSHSTASWSSDEPKHNRTTYVKLPEFVEFILKCTIYRDIISQ